MWRLRRSSCERKQILINTERIMSQITDLQTKFDTMKEAVKKAFTDASTKMDTLQAKIDELVKNAGAGGVDPAELAALSTDISTTSDELTAQATALDTKATT